MRQPAPSNAAPQIGRGLQQGRSVDLDFDIDAPAATPLMPRMLNVDTFLAKVNLHMKIS